jgi:hypothetical protein
MQLAAVGAHLQTAPSATLVITACSKPPPK